MALKENTNVDKAADKSGAAAGNAGQGSEQPAGSTGPTVSDLQTQLDDLQQAHTALTNQHEQLIADHKEELDGLHEQHNAKLGEKDRRIAQLEADLQNAKVASPASTTKAKPKKVTMKKVVSNTGFNYKIDGIQITPDKPVKLEHYEGNELDSLLQGGQVIEYGAED